MAISTKVQINPGLVTVIGHQGPFLFYFNAEIWLLLDQFKYRLISQ